MAKILLYQSLSKTITPPAPQAATPTALVFTKFSQPPETGRRVAAHLQPIVNFELVRPGAATIGPMVFTAFSQPGFWKVPVNAVQQQVDIKFPFNPPAPPFTDFVSFSQPPATAGKIPAYLQPQINFEIGFLGPAQTPTWPVFTDFSKPLFQKIAQQGNDVKYGIIRGPNFVTMTSDQGSYLLSGKATALNSAKTVAAAQGTYTVSGKAITLNRGIVMAAGKGTYTLNGINISTSAVRTMNTTTGAYTITGNADSLLRGRTIIAGPGTYTITGNSVTTPVALSISPTTGVYVETGVPITLLYTPINAPPQTHFLPFLVTVGPLTSR